MTWITAAKPVNSKLAITPFSTARRNVLLCAAPNGKIVTAR
jgi:hypothetical protein